MKLLNHSQLYFGILLTTVFCLTGCFGGDAVEVGPTVEVSGKITLDGKPVTKGTVQFMNSERGIAAEGTLGSDGTYSFDLKDTQAGETYAVSIGAVSATEGTVDEEDTPASDEAPGVPAKYQRGATSGLTAKITTESSQTFDFPLKKK